MQKIAAGWLKVLATGAAATDMHRSVHYRAPFEMLRDTPEKLIANTTYRAPPLDRERLKEQPLRYLGGKLRYTTPGDPALRTVTLGLRFVEQLARQHGRLLDQLPEARRLVEAWNGGRKFLF